MKTKLILLTILVFCISLSMSANRPSDMRITNSDQVDAEGLVKKSERAIAYLVRAGQASGDDKIQRNNEVSQPFWSAVKKLNSSVEKLNKHLFLKDDSFHRSLGETVTAKEQVLASFELLEAQDSAVQEALSKVSKSIDLLYENYSKEALRKNAGSQLSQKESEILNEIKNKNKELQGKLTELEAKLGNNKKMIRKLKKIREKSSQVVHCHHNSAGFFFAMSAMNIINGWIWASHWYWGPWGGWYPGFYYSYMDIYVHVLDDYAYDWGYLDGVIEAYEYDLDVDLEQVEMEGIDDFLYEPHQEAETDEVESDIQDNQDQFNASFEDEKGDMQDEISTDDLDYIEAPMNHQMTDDYHGVDELDYYAEPMDYDF